MTSSKNLFALLTAAAVATSVFAQVSPKSPAPDSKTLVTIEGRITKVEFTTPHVTLYVDAAALDSGSIVAWAVETGSLNELGAQGIKLGDLKVGRLVRARGSPASGQNRLESPVSEISFPQ